MRVLLGFLLGLITIPLLAMAFLQWGNVPAATSDAPFPFEKRLAHAGLRRAVGRAAPKTAALDASEANLSAGADVYRQQCAMCHGLPQTAAPFGKSMYPPPPQLLTKDDMVADDPVGVTYWKVANGIRLTGMPAFSKILNETQMWQVSQLLANADKLTVPVTNMLNQPMQLP